MLDPECDVQDGGSMGGVLPGARAVHKILREHAGSLLLLPLLLGDLLLFCLGDPWYAEPTLWQASGEVLPTALELLARGLLRTHKLIKRLGRLKGPRTTKLLFKDNLLRCLASLLDLNVGTKGCQVHQRQSSKPRTKSMNSSRSLTDLQVMHLSPGTRIFLWLKP